MCRLSAITFTKRATGIDTGRLLHEMMWRASLEEAGQRDGWGVSDTIDAWRSTKFYVEDIPGYIPHIADNTFLIGHVRKRSTGTGTSVQENHPYQFDINGQTMTAAHNGWIDGVKWSGWEQGKPQTDSWRALNDLAGMIRQENADVISPDLVSRWLSEYTTASHYAFIIQWGSKLYTVRGKTRNLNILKVGDGWLINTSGVVLRQMRDYAHDVLGIREGLGNVLYMKDDTMLTFDLNSGDYAFAEIKPVHKEKVYPATQSAWSNNTWINRPKDVSNGAGTSPPKEESGDGEEKVVVAPSVTQPRPVKTQQTAMVLSSSEPLISADVLKWRRDTWTGVAGKLSPLRGELSKFWAGSSLGIVCPERTDGLLEYVSVRDIEIFAKSVLSDAMNIKPFTTTAAQMINWWNHCVRDADVDVHRRLFGTNFFWLDTNYIHDDSPKTLLEWKQYFALLVLDAYKDNGELKRHFDVGKLFGPIKEREGHVDTGSATVS